MNKRLLSYITGLALTLSITGCTDLLDLDPLDRVSEDILLNNPEGLKTIMANLYNAMPIEDFSYYPYDGGFNSHGWKGGLQSTYKLPMYTDEASASAGSGAGTNENFDFWPYDNIRQTNMFFESLEKVKDDITPEEYDKYVAEAHFVRAYLYFGLAKRYGGVPIIDRVLDNDYAPGTDNESLYVPRSTEKETWNFIIDELDKAAEGLPEQTNSKDGKYRATKWAALALKSRVALYAASVAKYWNNAPLSGPAVDQNLAKMDASDANAFYQDCIDASTELINNGGFSLYQPTPASPAEAAVNFQNLFLTSNEEIIFAKAYLDGTTVANQGHCWDIVFNPMQTNPGFHKSGRYSPSLDIVDLFEDYTDNGTGTSAKIVTRTDGVENYSYAQAGQVDLSLPFKEYDNLFEPFAGKDARLLASVIVPGATWKGVKIIIQGGLIKTDGTVIALAEGSETVNGTTYYSYGSESPASYSGFFKMGSADDANYSNSGFLIKKYLQEGKTVRGAENSSTQSFIDMRLAEVYLNYAEAVVEGGLGDVNLAAEYINALRKRAGHTDQIPLTLANVLKERTVELAFEGQRFWDLKRRREFHQIFSSTRRKSLVPMVDLRDGTPKYIFVRVNNWYDERNGGLTVNAATAYYRGIPGTNTNKLVQNPGY